MSMQRSQEGIAKGRSRAFAFGACNVNGIELVEVRRLEHNTICFGGSIDIEHHETSQRYGRDEQ